MNELWTNKYKPIHYNQIIGKTTQLNQISSWLNNIKNYKCQAIVISGDHGVGKSTLIDLILKKFNYKSIIITQNDIKQYRASNAFKDLYNINNSINSKIKINNKNFSNKIAVIFDSAESISLTSEKKFIMEVFKENNRQKSFPIFFLTNNQHSKLLIDIKKQCHQINLYPPKNEELKMFIKFICKKEKLKIKNEALDKLISFSQNDLRRLLNLLQELSFHFVKTKIKLEDINEFIKSSREKNKDISLFEATSKIINNKLKYDEILKLYETEKVLLPLMIHENYPKKLINNKVSNIEDNLYSLVKVSDSISRGDNIETSIYTDQNWYLQNIHGFYTCINTNFWINNNNNNEKVNKIIFSQDLNKTSLKNINRKNINNLMKIVGQRSIQELLLLNKLTNGFKKEEKYDKIIEILKNYKKNLKIKDLELSIKIDKSNDFSLLTTKEKKVVEKFL